MQTQEIISRLTERFGGDLVFATGPGDRHPAVQVVASRLPAVCRYLKNEPDLDFDLLRCVTAVDWHEQALIELCYDLLSLRWNHAVAVKVKLDRARPQVASVASVWPAADWHEREAFDLMGVDFAEHPDLRRILMPDDWNGHPLRKDYQNPMTYKNLTVTE